MAYPVAKYVQVGMRPYSNPNYFTEKPVHLNLTMELVGVVFYRINVCNETKLLPLRLANKKHQVITVTHDD